jgi:hypothetical protein
MRIHKMNFQQHQWLGDNFDDANELNHIFFRDATTHSLSFGEVNGLSGDHYDVLNNWAWKLKSDSELDKLSKEMMQGMISGRNRAGMYPSTSKKLRYSDYKNGIVSLATFKDKEKYREYVRRVIDKITVELRNLGPWEGYYLSLARRNWNHYMPLCVEAYKTIHKAALKLASQVPESTRSALKPNGRPRTFYLDRQMALDEGSDDNAYRFAKALFLEACACHYLEDCFAGGHLRSLRVFYGTLYDAINTAVAMHVKDNNDKLYYKNSLGERQKSTGEDFNIHFFPNGSDITPSQLRIPKRTVLKSVSQIFEKK